MTRKIQNKHSTQRPLHHFEEDSDLSARKSPHPVPSSRMQSKSRSRSLSQNKLQSPFKQNNKLKHNQAVDHNIASQIQCMWENWREPRSMNNLDASVEHILQNVECSHEDIILLYYLRQVSEVETAERKMVNARLSIEFYELHKLEEKKVLLLKLLVEKLSKKLFFSRVALQRFRLKLEETDRFRVRRANRAKNFQKIKTVIEDKIHARLRQGMTNIANQAKLKNLLASNQSEMRKYSPIMADSNQCSNVNVDLNQQSAKDSLEYQHQEDSHEQSFRMYDKIVESEYTQKNTMNAPEMNYSPLDVLMTVRRLESEACYIQSKYMKRQEKMKKLYFVQWKIAFLYRHIESALMGNYEHNLKSKYFALMRDHRNEIEANADAFQESQEQQQESKIEKIQIDARIRVKNRNLGIDGFSPVNSYKVNKLKQRLKSKYLKKSLNTIKERANASKINKYVRQIHNQNILKKTFKALKEREMQLDTQFQTIQRQDEEMHQLKPEPSQTRHMHPLNMNKRDVEDPNFRISTSRLTEGDYYQAEELSKQQQFKVQIFRKAHLETKFFFILKNLLCFSKLFKASCKLLLRDGFQSLHQISKRRAAIEDKVQRFRASRNKLTVFRYFRAIKELMYKSQSAEVYIQYKDKLRLENAFSILKLEWKQRLIRIKKVGAVVGFLQKRSVFGRFKAVLLSQIGFSAKQNILANKRRLKHTRELISQLVLYSLTVKKAKKKINSTQSQILQAKTRLISSCFDAWNDLYKRKKQKRLNLEDHLNSKQANLKKNVFWLWMRMALLRKKGMISSMEDDAQMDDSKSEMESAVSKEEGFRLERSSRDHKYWLQKYYEQICAFQS